MVVMEVIFSDDGVKMANILQLVVEWGEVGTLMASIGPSPPVLLVVLVGGLSVPGIEH